MSIGIKIKKGLDLPIAGTVADTLSITVKPTPSVAINPDDFIGLVPKMEVREGDAVLAGQPLFHDKRHEEIKVVSPAAGKVKAVVRGERRKILRVEVEVAGNEAKQRSVEDVFSSPVKAKSLLLESGLWAMMSQRPYAVVPDPSAEIRDIFVTGFDSSPLAVAKTEFSQDDKQDIAAGVRLLGMLTSGKIYISCRPGQDFPPTEGAETVIVEGPHPAGNAGTVIAAVKPVNKGETVVSLDLPTLLRIGRTARTGIVPGETIVALTGSEIKQPKMVRTLIGAEIHALINGETVTGNHHLRIISGNVLTGVAVPPDGFLRLPYNQVTVIPEGDDVDEFMGWASVSPKKLSVNPSFPGRLFGRRLFNPDARLLGGRRAMIMSGQYDKVTPIDILPEFLIKAILSRDIDRMEQLGIYEIAPEDFALAEYVDTSKLELQKIVREGLDYMRKELE